VDGRHGAGLLDHVRHGAAIFGDAQKLRLFGSTLVVSATALFVMLRRDRDPSAPRAQPIRE